MTMHLLCTRTIRRAFLGDGWGLKRAMEAHQGVRSCLKAARVARLSAMVRGHISRLREERVKRVA